MWSPAKQARNARTAKEYVKMTSKIIIATDGSKYSEKAVDCGVDLAGRLGAEVIALYVISLKSLERFALGHHDDIGGYERANEELKTEGERALGYVAVRCEERGVKVSKTLVRGYPADEILQIASSERPEFVVVGSLGKTGLEHLLIGSVSEAVIKKAPCPVLVVKGK
jgi:nucleotide-binding universal stress UspA family protein